MTTLDLLKGFDVAASELTLWTFKKQQPKDAPPQFNGHWVETTADMDARLKDIVTQAIANIGELKEYGLLAQNNESSALTITKDETHIGIMAEKFAAETPQRKVRDVKTLRNCPFYVIKLVHNENLLFAVRKTNDSWKTRTTKNIVNAFFSDKQLDVASDENFRIQRSIDFFGIGDDLLIVNKSNFESVLNYRAAHEQDYASLIAEEAFVSIFDGLDALTAFVGNNKIHLRRMSAIRQKGFYSDEKFMQNLRSRYKDFSLNLIFDSEGRLVPTPETCRDIIAALLDHRLGSGFSGNIYDVPDATKV